MPTLDVLIKNATIVDGTGRPSYRGHIGLKGDRVAYLGREGDTPPEAGNVIDAQGRVAAPGFVDPHAHLELLLFLQPESHEYAAQGFTTVVNGNCGHSVTPYQSEKVLEYQYRNGLISPEFRDKVNRSKWTNFAEYREVVRHHGGTAVNHATLLGHGTLRWSVMGGALDRPPSKAEAAELEALVREGMEQGAFGLSTGLAYIPSRYADADEIIQLAQVTAQYRGVYASHIRYHIGIVDAVREAIAIGRASGARVQVSHLHMNSVESYQLVREAQNEGLTVAADTIPQSTGHLVRGDRLVQFIMTMSPELFDVGVAGVYEAIKTSAGRERVKEIEPFFSQDPHQVFIANTDEDALEGRTVADVAQELKQSPSDVIFDLLLERGSGVTFWFGRDRDDAGEDFPSAEVMQNPWMGPGSDIIMVEQTDPTAWYELMRPGCVYHFLKQAAKAGLSLEEAIRRMTSLPADHFQIRGRGRLAMGDFADLVLFYPEALYYPNRDEVDYRTSQHAVSGMDYVFVNGQAVIAAGVQNDQRPGRMLVKN